MPRNGAGVHTPPAASFPAVANTLIESTKFNNIITDISTALTGSMAADGQTTVTADIPMSSHKFTGLTAGSGAGHSVEYAQMNTAIAAEMTNLANTADSLKGAALIGGAIRSVDSIAALKALLKTGLGRVYVAGYYAPGDGGGGHYWYDSTDTTSTDNGGTLIVATDGGRWKLANIGRVSVKQFGAVGDYNATTLTGTDDSAAFLNAIEWAMTRYVDEISAGCVYVPDGQYLVTTNNFLGAIDFSTIGGGTPARIHFSMVGDGWNSQIYWKPSGAAGNYWMYQNTAGANNLIDTVISNMYFRLDSSNVAVGSTLNCFSLYGSPGYATQGMKLDRVKIVGADYPSNATQIAKAGIVIQSQGTVNADLTNMIGCRVRGMKTLLQIIDNAESVCHTFVATDAEVMYGNVFELTGGTSVNVFGGSFSMFSAATAYLVAVYPQGVAMAGTYNFNAIRCEFNYPDPGTPTTAVSNLILLDATSQAGSLASTFTKINFNNCNFYPVAGTARNTIKIDAATQSVINFSGCDLRDVHKVNVTTSKATPNLTSVGPLTQLTFRDGGAVASDLVTFASVASEGLVSARNCNGVFDYDLNANGSSYARVSTNRPLKTITIFGTSWPDPGNPNAMSITLPYGAILKAIRFRKEASGASATSYQLSATDGSAVPNYCSSTIGAQNLKHEASVDNLNIICTTALNRQVYIITSAGHAGSALSIPMTVADYAMVDYY